MLDAFINQMNEKLNDFLARFEPDYQAEMGQEFMCLLDCNTVQWSLIYVDSAGEAFYHNFVKRFPLVKGFSLFTLSFLHELGHLETEWDAENDIEKRKTEMSNEEYFNLHNEFIATEWAGEWIETHYSEAQMFDNQLRKMIDNFYEKTLDK